MTNLAPDALIARHVAKLMARPDNDRIPQVLQKAGLTLTGEKVTRGGSAVTLSDCQRYKRAIKEVYGDATYSFTKVNFVLGGCTCDDCQSGR